MNFLWLEDFLALAATGNFSRAAEERHMTQPAFVQVSRDRLEKALTSFGDCVSRSSASPDPCLDERCQEPRPDGALVVRSVAREHTAAVVADVAPLSGRKRPQPDRRPQPGLDRIQRAASTLCINQHERQATEGQDLVRAER